MGNDKRLEKWQKKHYNKREPKKPKEFRELQQKWYKKLKEDGFKDIEYVSPHTGNEEVGFFRISDSAKEVAINLGGLRSDERLNFWRAMSNYLQHNPEWYRVIGIEQKWLQRRYSFISEQFIEGESYRDISKAWKRLYPHRKQFSYFIVFQIVGEFQKLAIDWNRKHEEGLLLDECMDGAGKGEA